MWTSLSLVRTGVGYTDLGTKVAERVDQTSIPRLLRWSFCQIKMSFEHFFEQEPLCDEVLVAEPDEENQNYWKSSQIERPIGVGFIVPCPLTKGAGGEPILRRVSNTARRKVNEIIACSNNSNSAKDAEARQPRRSKKGPHMDKGERPRVPTSPSNNGADHTKKIRDPFSDLEFMKKHAKEVAKNVEEGLIRRFGHFFESLFRRDRH